MQKLYCYIDETGQDAGSKFFWVVAVVSDAAQDALRTELEEIEVYAGTRNKKWHNVRPKNRHAYLTRVLEKRLVAGGVFFGRYVKPQLYFFPTLQTVLRAVTNQVTDDTETTVIIDGVDRQSARKYANALRSSGVRSVRVIGRRDESEPLLRLADMWAGAVRAAREGHPEVSELVATALKAGYLVELT